MAKYSPNIMSKVVDTSVIAEIKHHSIITNQYVIHSSTREEQYKHQNISNKHEYHYNDYTSLTFGGCVQQAYSTRMMQMATISTMIRLLMFSCTKSNSSMPNRCTAFATQKNRPLITTDGMPDDYISKKASEVKEQKPIWTNTINTITKLRLERNSMCLEAMSNTAATRPMMLIVLIMLMLDAPNLFLMNVPRLLDTATVTLPTRPSKAICFYVYPCPSKITPNMPQYVQLVPTMLPQQTKVMNVNL